MSIYLIFIRLRKNIRSNMKKKNLVFQFRKFQNFLLENCLDIKFRKFHVASSNTFVNVIKFENLKFDRETSDYSFLKMSSILWKIFDKLGTIIF